MKIIYMQYCGNFSSFTWRCEVDQEYKCFLNHFKTTDSCDSKYGRKYILINDPLRFIGVCYFQHWLMTDWYLFIWILLAVKARKILNYRLHKDNTK